MLNLSRWTWWESRRQCASRPELALAAGWIVLIGRQSSRLFVCLFVVIVNVGVFLFLVDFVCRNTLFHLDEGTQGGFEGSNGVGLFVFVCFAWLWSNVVLLLLLVQGVIVKKPQGRETGWLRGSQWSRRQLCKSPGLPSSWYRCIWYLVIVAAVQVFIGAVMKPFDLGTW